MKCVWSFYDEIVLDLLDSLDAGRRAVLLRRLEVPDGDWLTSS